MKKPNKKMNSGFWMDTNVLDQDTDVITLNGYRRSIANFVRIVTGKQIPVTFNTQDHSYTDGKEVVISGVIKNDEFDSAVGLACHEASHILLSNFKMLQELVSPLSKKKGKAKNPFATGLVDEKMVTDVMAKYNVDRAYAESYVLISLKNLLNWVEDRRIDYHIFSTSPGYKGYYHAMYDKYFHSELITKGIKSSDYRTETMSDYMFRIINLTNEHRDLTALNGLQDIWNVINLENIDRLKSSEDALEVAKEIFTIIESNLEAFDSQADDSDMKSDSDCDCEDGEDGEGEDGEGQSKGQGQSGNGQPDPHKDLKGDKNQNSTADENGTGGEGEGEEGENEDGESQAGNADGEGGDADGEGEGSDKGGSPSEGEGGENGEGDGEGQNNKGSNAGGGSGGNTGEGTPLTQEEAEAIKAEIEAQRAFLNGEVDKEAISEEKAEELKAVADAKADMENVGKTYGGNRGDAESIRKNGINCIVYRNMTRSFIESGACPFSYKNYWSGGSRDNGYEKAVIEGLQKGVILGKKMQVRQESKNTYYNRQKKGGLDNRLVAEAGFGNAKIFGYVETEQYAPAYVHISIDASGSMSGKKFYQAQVAAVAIAKASTMVQGLDCVISYRGCTSGKPAMMIAYDSRVDSISKIRALFGAICPTGSTPEGLCFEAVLNEIVMGNDKQHSYFVNMSDGEPGFSGTIANTGEYMSYGGQDALWHTKDMVNKIRQRGVQVLSYFIGGGYSDHKNFKTMYGKDAAFVDVNNVMTIAKTMNKLFMKKAK